MKIWFDLTNSPHVHFFREMMSELEAEGHEIVITTRDKANTLDLLDMYGFQYFIVGDSYGKKLYQKIFGNLHRLVQSIKFIRNKNVDVAISQSSFTSPIVGFFTGIPSIYTNDNEHAMGNNIAFLFASKIFIPEFIPVDKVTNAFVSKRKVSQYPGVKEGIYLWRNAKGIVKNTHIRPRIYYRPEPYFAQYYKGKANPFDDVLMELKETYDIVILPRDTNQISHFEGNGFEGITVCRHPKAFDEIVKDCDLFIGAGGTMTREMAVSGIPTISVYQDSLLEVDRYLIDNGLMSYCPQLTARDVSKALQDINVSMPNDILLNKGKLAYDLIKSQLLSI